jgi:hypothetical protein
MAAPYTDVTRCDVVELLDTFCVSLQKIEVKRMGLGKKTGDRQSNTVVQGTTKSETPLDYMLRVMNDRFEDNRRRDDMAKAAASYVHAKFLAVEFKPSSKVLIDLNKSSAEIRQEMLEWMASRGLIKLDESPPTSKERSGGVPVPGTRPARSAAPAPRTTGGLSS